MSTDEPKKGGTPSRQSLYARLSKYAPEAIEVLVYEMKHGDNSNSRVGAAKALLAKAIPDLKAMEVSGKDGKELPQPLLVALDVLNNNSTKEAKEA